MLSFESTLCAGRSKHFPSYLYLTKDMMIKNPAFLVKFSKNICINTYLKTLKALQTYYTRRR